MPYTFTIDRAARLALVRGFGRMDLEESLSVPAAVAAEPEFEPEFGVVVDLRELEYVPCASDVVAVGRNLVRLRPLFRNRVAVVVPHALSLAAELGAAIAAAGGVSLRVFEDVDAARIWVEAGGPAARGAA